MMTYGKTFTEDDFGLVTGSTTVYEAVISAETHGLGLIYHMQRCIKRNEGMSWDNVVLSYEISENGDFHLYSEEPGVYRILLSTT